MAIKYQYAYDENKSVININDAVKGNSYSCISCNDTLVVKQGKIKKWHFAHKHEQDNCSVETYLHKLAKQRFCDVYSDCLANNKPFFIERQCEIKFESCKENKKFNICEQCAYRRIRTERFDLTKWFKNIEIERSIDTFRADLCLSTVDDSEKIFIEIHVTNKVSENKQNSEYRIIEIDIETEEDLLSFDNKILSPSEKIKFMNFNRPKKNVPNDGKCEKAFLLLFVNKNGSVRFSDDLSILKLNEKLSKEKDNWVEYRIVSPKPFYYGGEDCQEFEVGWDFYNGAQEYKKFIAYCANKNINVKSCFICRYHAESNKEYAVAPIFCKHLKKECKSTQAVDCECFRKEHKYVQDLLKK